MKKHLKILIIGMCLVLGCAFVFAGYRYRMHTLKTGFLLYAEPNTPAIAIYNIQSNEKTTCSVPGYTEIYSVGTYAAGAFCVGGVRTGPDGAAEYSICLYQPDKCEQTLPVPYKPVQVAALKETAYFAHGSEIYAVDRATLQCAPVVENVHMDRRDNVFHDGFFLNESGDLAFLRDSAQGLQLWCLSAGKEFCMGEVNSVFGWISNDGILALAEDDNQRERIYLIRKDASKVRQASLFKPFGSAAVAPGKEKMACWFSTNEPNWYQYGIADLKTGWADRYAFGDQLDTCMTLPKYVLWLEEEPNI